jgi:muramoyltetrapeptide carboxypeptidase
MQSLGVGIIALSSPLAPSVYEGACAFLKTKNAEVIVSEDPTRYYGNYEHLFSAGDLQTRLEGFYTLANDPQVSLILFARGGYGSMELLESFRPNRIRRRAELFLSGFSDGTAFLLALNGKKNIHPIHGPSLSSFNAEKSLATQHWQELSAIVQGEAALRPFGDKALELLCGTVSEKIKGVLMGGNLSILSALLGTPWAPRLGRSILFFEDTAVKPYALHRLLLQLKLASKLRSLSAVIVGDLQGCEHQQGKGPNVRDVLRDIFEPLRIPVYVGAPFGHAGRIAPLPLGRKAMIEKGILRLL